MIEIQSANHPSINLLLSSYFVDGLLTKEGNFAVCKFLTSGPLARVLNEQAAHHFFRQEALIGRQFFFGYEFFSGTMNQTLNEVEFHKKIIKF